MKTLSSNEIKEINKLYQSKHRKIAEKFIVEGPHLVKEAFEAGMLLKAYTTSTDYIGELISQDSMRKICKTDNPVKSIGICKFSGKNVLTDKILLLDAIQDPGNMGTILRTAKAFGFDTVILGDGCVDIYNDKVIRSTQGAIFKLNFQQANLKEFILNHPDYDIYGTDVNVGLALEEVIKPQKFGIVLGNEGNGISCETREALTRYLHLKMESTESLNVAIAGGIIMYHFR